MSVPASEASADELRLLGDSVQDFCKRALDIRRLRASHGNTNFDPAVWAEMAELGWAAVAVPETRGGLGLGARGVTSVCRELGRALVREPMLESAVHAAAILAAFDGTDETLAQLMAGEVIYTGVFDAACWQVPAACHARPHGDGFVLDGAYHDVPMLPDAARVLLPVELDGVLVVFDLATDTSGMEAVQHTLADGSNAADLSLRAVHCDAAACLAAHDGLGEKLKRAAALTSLGASAYLLGLAQALFDVTLDYVRTRRQFGRAIGSFQALQHRLVDLYMQLRLGDAALEAALEDLNDTERCGVSAARARQRACDAAMLTSREAIQMHGAIGYTAENDVALFVWRTLVMVARFGGGDEEFAAAYAPTAALTARDSGTAPACDIDYTPADGDWNAVDDDLFRRIVRGWLEANYPNELRHLPYQVRWGEIRAWHQCLLARGWAAPAWPREHGGMGLAPAKLLIYIEELERHGVARATDQGIIMVGPILFAHGNAEQRARFLGPALSGEHIWCQGYSEPNAGSDLAALSTRAVRDGDTFIVSGQKTWTSHALDATHMFCLVRTDPDARPQAGISFLLIDLDQPGIDIRPIPNLSGHVDFCEVFLDEVRVPLENLVGELNRGWSVAKALLDHERLFVGSPKLCQHALNQLRQLAARRGQLDEPVFAAALATATRDVLDLEDLYAEFAEQVKAGASFGADVAVLKIWSTETYTRLSELILKVAGGRAAHNGIDADTGIDALAHYYSARPAPIYAGSNEIQRNILAKHVLGLPST